MHVHSGPITRLVEARAAGAMILIACQVCDHQALYNPGFMMRKVPVGGDAFTSLQARLKCGQCGERKTHISACIANPSMQLPHIRCENELRYTVDVWDNRGSITRTLAVVDDYHVGRAAFEAAILKVRDTKITFRNRCQTFASVLGDSDRPDLKPLPPPPPRAA